jgi:hypothetical protein
MPIVRPWRLPSPSRANASLRDLFMPAGAQERTERKTILQLHH